MNKSLVIGVLAAVVILSVYFAVLTFVSGFPFAQEQFGKFWYFIITLSVGFGIQVGLYSFLRFKNKQMSVGTVAVTGMSSTLSMVSCCAHYLVNILPILGLTGILTLVASYQIQLFWVGLVFNFIGILYIANKVSKMKTI